MVGISDICHRKDVVAFLDAREGKLAVKIGGDAFDKCTVFGCEKPYGCLHKWLGRSRVFHRPGDVDSQCCYCAEEE